MKNYLRNLLRRVAEALLRSQRYRYLRAHLWDEAIREMNCGDCA